MTGYTGPSRSDPPLGACLEVWLVGVPADVDAALAALAGVGRLAAASRPERMFGTDTGKIRRYLRLTPAGTTAPARPARVAAGQTHHRPRPARSGMTTRCGHWTAGRAGTATPPTRYGPTRPGRAASRTLRPPSPAGRGRRPPHNPLPVEECPPWNPT